MKKVQPEFLPLPEAYERYRARKWGESDPVTTLRETAVHDGLTVATKWERSAIVRAIDHADRKEFIAHLHHGELPTFSWETSFKPPSRAYVNLASFDPNGFLSSDFSLDKFVFTYGPHKDSALFLDQPHFDEWLKAQDARWRESVNALGQGQSQAVLLLLDLIEEGRLTVDEFEARRSAWPISWSGKLDLPDPFQCPDWSLPMTVSWIRERTAHAVRKQWDDFRFTLGLPAAFLPDVPSVQEPLWELKDWCQIEDSASSILLSGVKAETGEHQPIARDELRKLRIGFAGDADPKLSWRPTLIEADRHQQSERLIYHSLSVPASHVIEKWAAEARYALSERESLDIRQRLITDVDRARGYLSPEEAEKIALEYGLYQLAGDADKVAYDPMKRNQWPLLMVLAWIVWRDVDAARRYWMEYRIQCTHWIWKDKSVLSAHEIPAGFQIEHFDPPSLNRMHLETLVSDGAQIWINLEDAQQQLWTALGVSSLLATGVRSGTNEPVEIPKAHWPRLFPDDERDVLRWQHGSKEDAYVDVLFESRAVIEMWPAAGASDDFQEAPEVEHIPDTAAPRRGGRKKGTGQYNDDPLLEEMRELIEAQEAKSVWEAAGVVVAKAKGAGTPDSIQKRLSGKFARTYSDLN